ncbi:hypothetical protein B7463_g11075, partial [Scytalidium lignicola]
MTAILLSQIFIPVESIQLGRLVTSVDHPHLLDYHDPAYSPAPVPTINIRAHYSGLGQESRTSTFSSVLTSLLSTGFSKRAKSRVRVETNLARTYTLQNSTQWFEKAVSSEDSRRWLERAIDQGDDVYFVVGFHTVTDAQIIYESAEGNEHTGRLGLPISLALNAAGVIAPLGDIADPQVGVHRGSVEGAVEHFEAPGEQICAFQYRKVCHRWLSSRSIDKTTLAKTPRWSAGDRWRDEEEGVEDILEVETMDLGRPEGEWDEVVADSETLLQRS